MADHLTLPLLLDESARRIPNKIAVEEPGVGEITYRDLAALSDRTRDRLVRLGVRPGDRVGIYMRKSIDAIASIFGAMKAGAAYVPVDPDSPAPRAAYILNDCAVQVALIENRLVAPFCTETEKIGSLPKLLRLEGTGAGSALRATLDDEDSRAPAPAVPTTVVPLDELAYILYTSGSTGKPKGVMVSQRNAMSFVDWCSEAFQPVESDRFSSHAPFHFDLSIHDIYVSLKHGATLILVSSEVGKEPGLLAPLIAERRITIWYSTPSILSFLAQYGKLERYDYTSLRIVHFAGEVFPIKHLRSLKALVPHPQYFNLYGPTETNVCTFFQVPSEIPAERSEPFPIGKPCSHYIGKIKVVDESGEEVKDGDEGELVAAGPGVMQGYWNLPERTASAFLTDRLGERWYRTGDIVVQEEDGNYRYVSRRDRMVKRRGYRIELGEIEAGLYRHPAVREAAVISAKDETSGVRIIAFLSCKEGLHPGIVELKRFCSENLPNYMVPDVFFILDELPKTSTNKTDYQTLKQYAAPVPA